MRFARSAHTLTLASGLALAVTAIPQAPAHHQAAPISPRLALLPSAPARDREGPYHPVAGAVTYGQADARFGAWREGRSHEGQDVFAPTGTSLVAVLDGEVLESGGGDARGNYVVLYDPYERLTFVYMHMFEPASVRPGQRVHAGQLVGRLGCTGSCFGAHLHFEVRRGRDARGEPMDPLPSLRRWGRLPG